MRAFCEACSGVKEYFRVINREEISKGKAKGSVPLRAVASVRARVLPRVSSKDGDISVSITVLHGVTRVNVAAIYTASRCCTSRGSATACYIQQDGTLRTLRNVLRDSDDLPHVQPTTRITCFQGVRRRRLRQLYVRNAHALVLRVPFAR